MTTPDWTQAACRGMDRELFFPIPGSSSENAARAVCERCDIRNECLDWALNSTGFREEHGIWGATSYADRYRIRRGILRRACPVCLARHPILKGTDQVCGACGISWPAVRQPNGDVDAFR